MAGQMTGRTKAGTKGAAVLCAALCLLGVLTATMKAKDKDDNDRDRNRCQTVTGTAEWSLIPSPNDPFGRILGPSTGNLKAAISAYLTSLAPQPDGSFLATSVETWVVGPCDILIFSGSQKFTPIPGQPVGTVHDSNTLTVTAGTGDFAGATGTIDVSGVGYNLFGPDAGPGNTFFDIRYRGSICTPGR